MNSVKYLLGCGNLNYSSVVLKLICDEEFCYLRERIIRIHQHWEVFAWAFLLNLPLNQFQTKPVVLLLSRQNCFIKLPSDCYIFVAGKFPIVLIGAKLYCWELKTIPGPAFTASHPFNHPPRTILFDNYWYCKGPAMIYYMITFLCDSFRSK